LNNSRDELLLRRERARARSLQLRDQWSLQVQALRAPLGVADRARDAMHWLVRNPEWPIGAALLLLLLRPVRVLRWAGLAWQGWVAYQRLRRVVGPRLSRPR
jgi:hypothetical protein